jgi:hypothetical protein
MPLATLCFLLNLSHLISNIWYTKFSSVHHTLLEQIYIQYIHYLCLPLNSKCKAETAVLFPFKDE